MDEISSSLYMKARVTLGSLDSLTDIIRLVSLFHSGHTKWGWVTSSYPILAGVLALCNVFIIFRNEKLLFTSITHFILFYLKWYAAVFFPIFNSGPQVLTFAWATAEGVHTENYIKLFQGDLSLKNGIIAGSELLGVILSIASFIMTITYYDRETPKLMRLRRFIAYVFTGIFCGAFRIWIGLLLLFTRPMYFFIPIVASLYIFNVIVFKVYEGTWDSLIYGFSSLFTPSGYARYSDRSSATSKIQSRSEVQRVRINQESKVKRTRFTLIVYNLISLGLYFGHFAIIETSELKIPRIVAYPLSSGLFFASLLCSLYFYQRVLVQRNASRTWESITPARANKIRLQLTDTEINPVTIETEPPKVDPEPSAPPMTPSEVVQPLPQAKLGNKKCDSSDCVTCELLVEGSVFMSRMTRKEYRLVTSVTCSTKNVIYLVTCQKCLRQYVGKTEQQLKQRHYGHRREIEKGLSPLGLHFAGECGYVNWRFQIIDQCDSTEDLKRREGYWLHELNTLAPWGLNVREEKA